MSITKLRITNFKRFRRLELDFGNGMNILVGRNAAGKSTVLEAIHLAITGLLHGRSIRTELSQHLFNKDAIREYLISLHSDTPTAHRECSSKSSSQTTQSLR